MSRPVRKSRRTAEAAETLPEAPDRQRPRVGEEARLLSRKPWREGAQFLEARVGERVHRGTRIELRQHPADTPVPAEQHEVLRIERAHDWMLARDEFNRRRLFPHELRGASREDESGVLVSEGRLQPFRVLTGIRATVYSSAREEIRPVGVHGNRWWRRVPGFYQCACAELLQ